MIVTIEPRPLRRYCVRMRSLAIKLLALIAVLMLPLGMAAAPAQVHDAAASAAMPMHHEAAHHANKDAHSSQGVCTMACSAALPAAELDCVAIQPLMRIAPDPAIHSGLAGIELEIATPPPKLA